eukprot:9092092-Pyramimonas_sp.AAC.1
MTTNEAERELEIAPQEHDAALAALDAATRREEERRQKKKEKKEKKDKKKQEKNAARLRCVKKPANNR